MQTEDLADQLEHHGDRLGDLAADLPLSVPVPSCPDWEVRDLVRHVGAVHRWATAFVLGRTDPIAYHELITETPPDSQLIDWYRGGHRALVEAIRAAPTDLVCWTSLRVGASPLAIWTRRQAHETAIHRLDASLAAAEPAVGFDSWFALDGIDEMLVAYITRPGRGARSPEPVTIEFRATDHERAWWVRFDANRCVGAVEGAPVDARVSGPASSLYQALWNRVPYDGVTIEGNADVVARWAATVHGRWG